MKFSVARLNTTADNLGIRPGACSKMILAKDHPPKNYWNSSAWKEMSKLKWSWSVRKVRALTQKQL